MQIYLVQQDAIRRAAIVRTFQQTSNDCAGYVATWLRAAAKNKDYWGKHFDHFENTTRITTEVRELGGDARLHIPTRTVGQYSGKVVQPPAMTKANTVEQLEKSDQAWAKRKGKREFGMKIDSARNPRLGTYICYGIKTLQKNMISNQRWLLDFDGDIVLETPSPERLMSGLLGLFENSYQGGLFSFYGLSSTEKGHAVGLYRQQDSACYFDSNVGEFTMPLRNFLDWFRENWENFEYPFNRLNGMNFKLRPAQ